MANTTKKILIGLSFLMTLPASAYATGSPRTTPSHCPAQVHARIQIGSLRATNELEDREFSLVANSTQEKSFVRDAHSSSCLLLQEEGAQNPRFSTSLQMYLQIQAGRDGTQNISLEGYTPANRKIYSIRMKLPANSALSGMHEAVVYDGSGPSRERLGSAQVYLND